MPQVWHGESAQHCHRQRAPSGDAVRLPEQLSYFFNQNGKVGTGEGEFGRGDTMVLDVRRNVLVVRKATGQAGIGRMFLGIIPVQLLLTLPDLVRIDHDALAGKIHSLKDAQHKTLVELDLAFQDADPCATRIDANGVPAHKRGTVQSGIDGLAVGLDGR